MADLTRAEDEYGKKIDRLLYDSVVKSGNVIQEQNEYIYSCFGINRFDIRCDNADILAKVWPLKCLTRQRLYL